MAKPCFIIIFGNTEHDYSKYLAEDGLTPEDNDLDADGSGRNILDGLMHRNKIATKEKWAIKFNRLPAEVMSRLLKDIAKGGNYIKCKMLDAKENRRITKEYYCSAVKKGVQRSRGGQTFYDGCTFNITER